MPVLAEGEPSYSTDTRDVYIGTGTENVNIANYEDLEEHDEKRATTDAFGHVQLSNDTNSTDDTRAATPNAVKQVADNSISVSEKGVAGGVASLNNNGEVLDGNGEPVTGGGAGITVSTSAPSNPKDGTWWYEDLGNTSPLTLN